MPQLLISVLSMAVFPPPLFHSVLQTYIFSGRLSLGDTVYTEPQDNVLQERLVTGL